MKRYEYPGKIARIGFGLAFGFMGCALCVFDVNRTWPLGLIMLVAGALFGLRPMDYAAFSDGGLWYARTIGKGHVCLDEVVSITFRRLTGRAILHTAHRTIGVKAILTNYFDLLERMVAGCVNAKIDSLTRELLDKESVVHKRHDRCLKIIHLTANISGMSGAVFSFVWLLQAALTR